MKLFGYEFIVRKAVPQEAPLLDVRRISLNDGDKVVFTTEHHLSQDQAEMLRTAWETFSPDTRALVLSGGIKLNVLGQTSEVIC